MSLSLLRDSFLIFIVFFSFSLHAETFSSVGTYLFPTNISEEECFDRAKNDAVKKVMEMAGFSYITHYESLNCSDIEDKNICEYYQDSQQFYEGGFITNKIFSNPELLEQDSIKRKCKINLEAKIEKFKSNHDPNFIFNVTINNNLFKNREEIEFYGETNLSSNLYVFSFDKISEEYQIILPNEYESLIDIEGKFKIPNNKSYKILAVFPEEHKKDIVQEHFLILVTKSNINNFKVIDSESLESLFSRLNHMGRENWKKVRLNYFILKESIK